MTETLLFMYKNFLNAAKGLPNFIDGQKEDVPYDITELANGYCAAEDAGDEVKKNQYISALMIRYWHMVSVLYEQSKSTKLEITDMVDWVYEGLMKAFSYRSWLDPNKAISKDEKGAEKCFNQCITSIRGHYYQRFNSDKRKINYLPLDSLDTPDYESEEGISVNRIETLVGDNGNYSPKMCESIINKYIKDNKLLEALIIDGIAYRDSFDLKSYSEVIKKNSEDEEEMSEAVITEDTVVNHYAVEFNTRKLVKHLTSIFDSEDFAKQLSQQYHISLSDLLEATTKFKSLTCKRMNKLISKTLNDLKYNIEVQSELC